MQPSGRRRPVWISGKAPRPMQDHESIRFGLIGSERDFPAAFSDTLDRLDKELMEIHPEFAGKFTAGSRQARHIAFTGVILDWLESAFDLSVMTEDQIRNIQDVLSRRGRSESGSPV